MQNSTNTHQIQDININHFKITTMQTTINNNLRVYQVTTSTGKQAFCNIDELNNVCANLGTHAGYFKIFHFWNNKPQKLSKKALDTMFEGSQLKREFNY